MKKNAKSTRIAITLLLLGGSFIFILAKGGISVKNKIDVLNNNSQQASVKIKVLNIITGIEDATGINNIKLKELREKGWITILSTSAYSFLDTSIFYLKDKNNSYLLDLAAHGNADAFCSLNITEIIKEINKKCTLDTNTIIYLNGCNTGLYYTALGMSVAQKLANEVHCIVYGARGYLSGTYAQRNEHCTPQNTSPSDAYPGAVVAKGDAVWVRCMPDKDIHKIVQTNDAYYLNLTVDADNKLLQALAKQLNSTHLIQDSLLIESGISMFPDCYVSQGESKYTFYNNFNTIYDFDKKEFHQTDSLFRKELVSKIKQVK